MTGATLHARGPAVCYHSRPFRPCAAMNAYLSDLFQQLSAANTQILAMTLDVQSKRVYIELMRRLDTDVTVEVSALLLMVEQLLRWHALRSRIKRSIARETGRNGQGVT